jgi:serine phosphatase RsbU (regulator of sigma subunit)
MMDAARNLGKPAVCLLKSSDISETWPKLKPVKEDEEVLLVGERLMIAIPLLIKSDLFGVLLVEESKGARRFRARRFEIINGIAQQIALAIQNDRLQSEMVVRERLETEIQLAQQIQQTFIPERLPEHPGWELAARWKTARQVGGDFYDLIELPNHKLGIIIADVADKGVPAALFMALTRTLVRAAAFEAPTPADALQRVNELLIPDTRQGMFVTAVYAVLDQETGDFTYANAGHNPPFWIRFDGQIEKLTRTGIALGVLDANPISQRKIRINPGESVLLYTDGVTEAFSPDGGLFGESRLIEIIRSNGSNTAESLLDAVDAGLDGFIGPLPLSDDLTLLVIKRK